jgi:valyl-tRNA synthetase
VVSGRIEGGIPVTAEFDFQLLREERADRNAERGRLEKEKEKLEQALARVEGQLKNRAFVERAPEEVVRATENRRAELQSQFQRVAESLERLS